MWYMFAGSIDLACMAISWIPGIDLFGWPLKIFGIFSLLFYFLIKGVFKGKRFFGKLITFVLGGGIAAVPAIDDFIPSLTGVTWNMYHLLDKEAEEEAAEAVAKTPNDNARQPRLSRAA
ncbi:MAG: hypothetical protein JWL88_161 [Parcubacteria group bacterium]|nr:hypothetical protein [Parcubacteria group bacterium]